MSDTIDNKNSGNPYMSSLGGGGAGGSPYAYGNTDDDVKIAYGGQARIWDVDGSYYAGGGGGATMRPENFSCTDHVTTSEDIQIQKYGTGGGVAYGSGNNSHSNVLGGSGIRVMNAVATGTTYMNPYCYIYAGYDDAYASYQSNFSRDGTIHTGSGGGGGFAHSIAEADLLMYHGGYTGYSTFSSVMYTNYTGHLNKTDQQIYEGFNGSGASGRVKIAIPKQINGVDIIDSTETGYTGT